MPVFFFVGGYANLVGYESARRRGDPVGAFVRSRVRRLLVPSAALLAVWAVVQVVLHLTDTGAPTGPAHRRPRCCSEACGRPGRRSRSGRCGSSRSTSSSCASAPLTVALHRRFRWWVPAVFVVGTLAADLAGFVGGQCLAPLPQRGVRLPATAPARPLLRRRHRAPLAPRRASQRWPRSVSPVSCCSPTRGCSDLRATTRFDWFPGIGYYPRSLLGTDGELVSNAYPPTICFMFVGFWLIGLALLLRPRLSRWLDRPRPWRATILGNAWIMTLFLWHMTAYLVAILLLWPLGFGEETEPTARWWLERPVWILVPGVLLAGLVAVVRPLRTRTAPVVIALPGTPNHLWPSSRHFRRLQRRNTWRSPIQVASRRRADRRTLPASSRRGSSTTSIVRGSL